LGVSFSVVLLSLAIALPVGLLSGYIGGRADYVLTRVVDAGLSLPRLVMALAIAGVMGPGVRTAIIALTIVTIPYLIRFVRGETLARSHETYVEASVVAGTPLHRILRKRLLRNIRSPLLVTVAFLLGGVLLSEAALSYLGVGAQPPTSSWGTMLQQAYSTSLFTSPFQLVVPGVAIALTILALYTLGDGLRDVLGVSLRTKPGKNKGPRGLTVVVREHVGRGETSPGEIAEQNGALLRVRGLTVEIDTPHGKAAVVEDVGFDINPQEVLGLVGERGSGKTITTLGSVRLIPSPPAQTVSGSVLFEGRDLLSLHRDELRRVRGAKIAMIFQDPMTALDPCFTIGKQLEETYRIHHPGGDNATSRLRAVDLLDRVKIPSAAKRLTDYPHELSGGMRQRVMIAMALICDPVLLLADEPTTALDVTIQAQVLALLRDLQRDTGMSILFVTHDFGVVAEMCDRVVVMYAGQVIETNVTDAIFTRPQHPYTQALLAAVPEMEHSQNRLEVIPGHVPLAGAMPSGCRFHPRCKYATTLCTSTVPLLARGRTDSAEVRCLRAEELLLQNSPR